MKLFDKVTYASSSHYRLHCSTSYYSHAYVVSLDPLILISESGDMKWSCLSNPEELIVISNNESLPLGTIKRCIRECIGDYILPQIKQIVIVRNDLKNKDNNKIKVGKLAVQVAHASLGAYKEAYKTNTAIVDAWEDNGTKKICLAVNSKEELLELYDKLKLTAIPIHLVTDNGLTEFSEPTITCLGIGPWYSSDINKFTKNFYLL